MFRVHPSHTEKGPEVQGQFGQDVVVGQPAVALIALRGAPGIANQQRAGSDPVAFGVLDLLVVVIAHSHDGMTPLSFFARARVRNASFDVAMIERRKPPETEHGWNTSRQIFLDAGEHDTPAGIAG